MIKYIITKDNKEFKAYGINAKHCDIIKDNGLNSKNIIDEGFIENGKRFSWNNFSRELNTKAIKARETESLYMYGYIKQGD